MGSRPECATIVRGMETCLAWVTAIASVLTALGTLALAVFAWKAWDTAHDTLEQMKRDSIAQAADSARASRPYVFLSMVPSIAGTDSWDLIVESSGRSAAFDLCVRVLDDNAGDDEVTKGVRRLGSAALTLAPGQRIRTYWSIEATKPNALGYPMAMRLEASYRDDAGTVYREVTRIPDPGELGLTPVPFEGVNVPLGAKARNAKNIVNALRGIARNVGELRR